MNWPIVPFPFFNQTDFVAFGKTADGPFGFVFVETVTPHQGKPFPMAHYKVVDVTERGTLEIYTVKLEKIPRAVYRKYDGTWMELHGD